MFKFSIFVVYLSPFYNVVQVIFFLYSSSVFSIVYRAIYEIHVGCELMFAKYDSGDEKEDDTEVDKEHEVGGEPLQQMPESKTKSDMIEEKSIPYLESADEDATLSKSEVRYEPDRKLHDAANSGDENDVKMEEAKGEENGTDKTHSVHSSPCEEVPQPGLDSVK